MSEAMAAGRSKSRAATRAPLELERQPRRLVGDEILELLPELLGRDMRGRRELRELVRILEVVLADTDHVAARDRIARRSGTDEADARPAGRAVDHVRELDRHEPP